MKIGDILVINSKNTKSVKILQILENKIFVREIKIRVYDYIESKIEYCIDYSNIVSNLGNLDS